MLRIVSKADTAESFIQIFAHLCDRESLFIVTRSPKPIGTETRFSINLKTGEPVIRGQGKVIERFEDKDNPYGRMGMRLSFMELDGTSRDFIDRLVAAKQAHQAAGQASATQILGTEATEPANTRAALAAVSSGILDLPGTTASDKRPATTPPRTEERARGSDFILPANPFGELTDNVLEAFIECSLYEEMASSPDADTSGSGEKSESSAGRGHSEPEPPRLDIASLQQLRPASIPLATPPFPVAAASPPPVPPPGPPPVPASLNTPPPGSLPAQPIPGPTPVPAMPVAPAPTMPVGSFPGTGSRTSGNSWRAIVVAVILATLVSLGIGYLIWGSGDRSSNKDESPSTPQAAGEPDTRPANDTATGPDQTGTAADSQQAADTTANTTKQAADPTAQAGAEGAAATNPEGAGDEQPAGDSADPATDKADDDTAGGECQASIASDPARAMVYLGEREMGATPLDVTLPCGEVELRITRARRHPKIITTTLTPGEVTRIEADLARPTVELVVDSDPAGADVSFNGRNRGKTPLTLQVAGYRSATVEIKKAGYKPHKQRVYPKGPRSRVNARLRKLRRR